LTVALPIVIEAGSRAKDIQRTCDPPPWAGPLRRRTSFFHAAFLLAVVPGSFATLILGGYEIAHLIVLVLEVL
jgi:hypothetical protein